MALFYFIIFLAWASFQKSIETQFSSDINMLVLFIGSWSIFIDRRQIDVMNYGVGIDLGTTRCCIAIQDNNGLIQIVPNDIGKLISNCECGKRPYDEFQGGIFLR